MGSTKENSKKPRVVSIFSGCGGLDYGFHMEGYETIWANDFAEWACKSFAANFGNVIHYKDITKIDPYTDSTIPECDIVLGGFACQDFSIIWKQPGLNGTRGGLFRHFAEFVDAKNHDYRLKSNLYLAKIMPGVLNDQNCDINDIGLKTERVLNAETSPYKILNPADGATFNVNGGASVSPTSQSCYVYNGSTSGCAVTLPTTTKRQLA